MPKSHEDSNVLDRTSTIREVIENYLIHRNSFEPVNRDQIIEKHPDLMPELGRELRKLELISGARIQAESYTASENCNANVPHRSEAGEDKIAPDSFPGYEIVRRIHHGSQGVVYQALQKATHRKVAIKVMREGMFAGPNDKIRFEREVQVLGALKHPHIVTIHESGSAADHFYFVMDYISGAPLDVYITSHSLTMNQKLQLFAKICEAVNAAHLQGIIHRDLKPSNIRIDNEGEPHILDFGLARTILKDDSDSDVWKTMTITGQFVGSLPWASPEQVDGIPGRIDLRTDVYSLGVILYQMLTGCYPYNIVGNMREVMDNIIHAQPCKPSSIHSRINDEIETIVLKCLSKEQERRYQSAGELARDINHYLCNEPIEAKRDSTWYVIKKTVYRYKIPTAIAVLFIMVITAFSITMSLMYRQTKREAEISSRVQTCLETLFTELGYSENSSHITVREILDQGAERVVEELQDVPEAQANIMVTIANRYGTLGLHIQKAQWLDKALTIQQDLLDEKPELLAASLYDIGLARSKGGEHDKADEALSRALRLYKEYSMNQPNRMPCTLRELAHVSFMRGDSERADRLYNEALELCRSSHQPYSEKILSLIHYGVFLDNRGNYQRAKAMIEEALTLARHHYEGDHTQVTLALRSMAALLQSLGHFEEALPFMQEAHAMIRRLYRGDHGKIVMNSMALGLLYKDLENYNMAESIIRDALDMRYRLSDGQDTKGTAYGHHCLAKVYTDAGDWIKAEESCRTALELHLKILPSDCLEVARPMTHLGRILVHFGRFSEAEPLLREALAIRKKRKSRGHWKTAKTESILGAALTGLGRFEEAEQHLLDSYPIIVKDRGSTHRRTIDALQRIINLYEDWNITEEADKYRMVLQDVHSKLRMTN